jgi:threonine dehydrogenase-like Zn-dependent dehydrogenase
MRGLLWKGGSQLDYQELEDAEPAVDEVVLAVTLAGICGSDLHGYRGHPGPRVPPLVLGHEAVGTLDGERFVVFPLIGCGTCAHCIAGEENLCPDWRLLGMHRAGVFAEQVALPRSCLYPVAAELPDERAVLVEPLACAVGAMAPYAIAAGTRVAVIGCGPIGLLCAQLAIAAGAEVSAIDTVGSRRAQAERLGAVAADASELAGGASDLIVDAAGFEATWAAALKLARPGAEVVVLGLGQAEGCIGMASLVRRSIRMRGQFAYSRADFEQALRLLATDALDLSWCSIEPLSGGADAFRRLVEEPDGNFKIVLAV